MPKSRSGRQCRGVINRKIDEYFKIHSEKCCENVGSFCGFLFQFTVAVGCQFQILRIRRWKFRPSLSTQFAISNEMPSSQNLSVKAVNYKHFALLRNIFLKHTF